MSQEITSFIKGPVHGQVFLVKRITIRAKKGTSFRSVCLCEALIHTPLVEPRNPSQGAMGRLEQVRPLPPVQSFLGCHAELIRWVTVETFRLTVDSASGIS